MCSRPCRRRFLSDGKKIPGINRRNRVCFVGPGVTYKELAVVLKEQGMTLPTAPRLTRYEKRSCLRNRHGWPRMQWDMQDPVACTEFIYGTGELFRVICRRPGNAEDQRKSKGAQKMPMGPGQTDFQRVSIGAQGSMGIMTWISLRTELLPSFERPMLVASDRLSNIVEYVYQAQRPWLGELQLHIEQRCRRHAHEHIPSPFFRQGQGFSLDSICLQNIAGFDVFRKDARISV